jgi:hypothetical protein
MINGKSENEDQKQLKINKIDEKINEKLYES